MRAATQIEFDLSPDRAECSHEYGYETAAYVPGGEICSDCGLLTCQYIPQPPEVLGYLSATWAWHHRDGKPWTTQTKPEPED
jgi:hypothetical protein